MDKIFQYGQLKYQYYLERAERRSFRLVVYPNLKIHLIAPISASDEAIERFMKRKWVWLDAKLAEMKKYYKNRYARQYLAGENFYYLGRQYQLKVERGKDLVRLKRGRIVIFTRQRLDDSAHNQKLFNEWLSLRRRQVFHREYQQIIRELEIANPPKLIEREMKTRWGSFQRVGIIKLNPRLIEAPREAIRYVILHELCHINHQHHTEEFYTELFRYMPNWQITKERLEVKFG